MIASQLNVSDCKRQVLRNDFHNHLDFFDDAADIEESFSPIDEILLVVVQEQLNVRGKWEDVTFILSVCSPGVLVYSDTDFLLLKILSFLETLVDLKRITLAEQGRLHRGFLEFLTTYRESTSTGELFVASSEANPLMACGNGPALRLLRHLFCLSGSPLFSSNPWCVEVGLVMLQAVFALQSSAIWKRITSETMKAWVGHRQRKWSKPRVLTRWVSRLLRSFQTTEFLNFVLYIGSIHLSRQVFHCQSFYWYAVWAHSNDSVLEWRLRH